MSGFISLDRVRNCSFKFVGVLLGEHKPILSCCRGWGGGGGGGKAHWSYLPLDITRLQCAHTIKVWSNNLPLHDYMTT